MPTIHIQNTEIPYDEGNVIAFDEGLIGLPHLRRLVIVTQPEIAPFLWLASTETPASAFLVMEPRLLAGAYAPEIPAEIRARIGLRADEDPLLLAIAIISPEWRHSSINLKAPLVIAPGAMRGTQLILSETAYRLDEPLAALSAAA
ncbi:MAG: flagellar assembly protein FliW [Blastocatellia bacterium]|nr:flagellar assembly protein FliW [Blastocatellia bacterium]